MSFDHRPHVRAAFDAIGRDLWSDDARRAFVPPPVARISAAAARDR
jgi:hypothetical protein